MIIFDERKRAEAILKDCSSKYISLQDLCILAKYFRDKGWGFKKIEHELENHCLLRNPNFNVVRSGWMIEKAIASAKKYGLREAIQVSITESELESIRKIDNIEYEKILFLMLVVAKFFKYNNTTKRPNRRPELLGYYINHNFREVLKITGVHHTKKVRDRILYELCQAGYCEPTWLGSIRLKYGDDKSEPIIFVSDYDNLIFDYLRWRGETIVFCEDCGKPILCRKKAHKRKYCSDCYKKRSKASKRKWFKENRSSS